MRTRLTMCLAMTLLAACDPEEGSRDGFGIPDCESSDETPEADPDPEPEEPSTGLELRPEQDSCTPPPAMVDEVTTAAQTLQDPGGQPYALVSQSFRVLTTGHLVELEFEIRPDSESVVRIQVEGDETGQVTVDVDGGVRYEFGEMNPDDRAALLDPVLAEQIGERITTGPQAFPCSGFGKKVVGTAKFMGLAMIGAGAALCCFEGGAVACALCGAAGTAGGTAYNDAMNEYCD